MKFPRSSGILLHPTSLPGPYGIGELGPEAHAFADFLHEAGQRIWQVLPLGPTGYGDSPYQCFSAFAGNPMLISLERLVERGYLASADIAEKPKFPEDNVAFGEVIAWKRPLLQRAFKNFQRDSSAEREEFERFCRRHASWLDEYALFMAAKDAYNLVSWMEWEPELALREPAALEQARATLRHDIECNKFIQFEFERQWCELKAHCARNEIRIMGDMPIYVALDSADVWSHRELFELQEDGRPRVVAGVPPDYFSATGQLWGNPIYSWEAHDKTGYTWWIARFRRSLEMLDMIRLDHFRGFEAYYEIPAGETTAINGSWVRGPGAPLFSAVRTALGDLPIVAENLGVITPAVEELRNQFEFPGMAILQFAFGNDPQAPDFKPHNYPHHLVAYTGTHDNDTVVGWWNSKPGAGSIRTEADVDKELAYAKRYLNTDGHDINLAMIRTLMASVADTVLFPLQDVLGVGSEGRMNLPGTSSGNWRWRFRDGQLSNAISTQLKTWAETYER